VSSPSYTVRLLDEAAAEVRQAVRWYRQAAPGVDKAFLATLKQAVRAIRQNPYAYPQVLGSARRVLLRRYPYAIY
jgi:plasmid stabilization system protein ParE